MNYSQRTENTMESRQIQQMNKAFSRERVGPAKDEEVSDKTKPSLVTKRITTILLVQVEAAG